jgi:hypothetical protein
MFTTTLLSREAKAGEAMSKSIMAERPENQRLSEVIRNHEKLSETINPEFCNQGVGGSSPSAGTNEINNLIIIRPSTVFWCCQRC